MRNRNRHHEDQPKPRVTVIRLLLAGLIILALAIGVGVLQNRHNDPLHGCKPFKTYTEYKGYNCSDGSTRWVPPQK